MSEAYAFIAFLDQLKAKFRAKEEVTLDWLLAESAKFSGELYETKHRWILVNLVRAQANELAIAYAQAIGLDRSLTMRPRRGYLDAYLSYALAHARQGDLEPAKVLFSQLWPLTDIDTFTELVDTLQPENVDLDTAIYAYGLCRMQEKIAKRLLPIKIERYERLIESCPADD
jgi:hypothetical protein